MSVEMLRYRIIESIKLLASDGAVQLSCYPDFVCKGDEIANSLGDWLLLYSQSIAQGKNHAFSPEELKQIISLDEAIAMLAPGEFSDEAILNSDSWTDVRQKAKETLLLLRVQYSLPDKGSV